MDARVREESQSRRTSIKRPWDDITLPEEGNAQHLAFLPPIDAVAYRRPSIPRGPDTGGFSSSRYGPEIGESLVKKPKFEGYDYNSFSPQISESAKIPPPRPTNLGYTQHRGSVESPIFPPKQRAAAGGPAESREVSSLCSRCKRLTTQDQELDLYGVADIVELAAHTMSKLAAGIQSLHSGTNNDSGLSSDQRGIIREPEQRDFGSADCPPIAEFGLKQTLNWMLGRINQCNYMVDDLVRQVPAGTSQNIDKDALQNGPSPRNGPVSIMKRRIDVDSGDSFRTRTEAVESTSDAKAHTRRRSVTTAPLVGEDFPPMRSQHDYQPSLHSSDGQASRTSNMHPPLAPGRQLPSPPGRSFPSPTSLNFPSPSTSSYGNTTQGVNLPPPSNLHQSTINNYLPPIAPAHSPDSALRDHTAALQHEVSVQKIALSSLQGEHDKLLAAFSRSQTRASALEKKHAVSDSEIISLSEERMRLQNQISELERDVEELSRSRDEFRQAAVQEGSQYIEIVKKASRLEEIAGEERKTWNKLKGEMEQRIEALSGAKNGKDGTTLATSDFAPARRIVDDIDTDTPASSVDFSADMKIEPASELQSAGPTSYPSGTQQESAEDLQEEIRRLREKCAEVEGALRAMRDDSRSMEGLVKALLDRAGSALND